MVSMGIEIGIQAIHELRGGKLCGTAWIRYQLNDRKPFRIDYQYIEHIHFTPPASTNLTPSVNPWMVLEIPPTLHWLVFCNEHVWFFHLKLPLSPQQFIYRYMFCVTNTSGGGGMVWGEGVFWSFTLQISLILGRFCLMKSLLKQIFFFMFIDISLTK